jgi:hypothetical protein
VYCLKHRRVLLERQLGKRGELLDGSIYPEITAALGDSIYPGITGALGSRPWPFCIHGLIVLRVHVYPFSATSALPSA